MRPNKQVQARVLARLMTGKSVTGLQAVRDFSTTRLSSYINRLRKLGHAIHTERVTEKGVTFARYWLSFHWDKKQKRHERTKHKCAL